MQEIEELAGFAKPIRYCLVDDGESAPRGVICGATNFAVGDLVVLARPGTVLPGDFAIAARTAYGRTSDGMICSAAELRLGDDHTGIIVLAADAAVPGDSAVEVLGLDDAVIELAITPDRGYCLSARGLARELAIAFDVDYVDPGLREVPQTHAAAWPVRIEDERGCHRFLVRQVSGLDAAAESPWWMRRRLQLAGMRPISLAVDVTNYVMLELGQPMHAFDATKLDGDLVVRRAAEGEKLTTLDGVCRELDPDDMVICDSTGPVSLAAVMGGESTEIGPQTTSLLLEAAIWDPASVARAARRHKLPSEAARRFERGVDPALPPVAAELAATLLTRYGGGEILPGRTDVGAHSGQLSVVMPIDLPDRVAGRTYERGATVQRLSQIGCAVQVGGADANTTVTVAPPSWRPDLTQPADLVEEVLRLEGYDTIPSELPPAPPGRGLTATQRRRRTISRALAGAGYVEVLPSPFVSASTWDAFGLPEDDPRRRTVTLLNPLESDRDQLATTLLPGLLEALIRNVARGQREVALYGMAQVVQPHADAAAMPDPGVLGRPSDAEVAALIGALPGQPLHVGTVLAGQWERPGWWGPGRSVTWADAVQAARLVGHAAGVELAVRAVAKTAMASRPMRAAAGRRSAGGFRRRVAPRRSGRAGLAAEDLCDGAGSRRVTADRLAPRAGGVALPASAARRRAGGGRGGAGRRADRHAAPWCRRAAGGRAPVRRLHRRPDRCWASDPWPSPYGSAPPTAPSPPPKPPPPATQRSPPPSRHTAPPFARNRSSGCRTRLSMPE